MGKVILFRWLQKLELQDVEKNDGSGKNKNPGNGDQSPFVRHKPGFGYQIVKDKSEPRNKID